MRDPFLVGACLLVCEFLAWAVWSDRMNRLRGMVTRGETCAFVICEYVFVTTTAAFIVCGLISALQTPKPPQTLPPCRCVPELDFRIPT